MSSVASIPGPVEAGPVAVLDWDHLIRQTLNDVGLAQDVMRMFLDQAPTLLRAVRDAGSADHRRDAAHKLKGSALAIGAFSVADHAQQIEALPREAGDAAVLDALAGLHASVAEVRSAIAARLGGSGGGL